MSLGSCGSPVQISQGLTMGLHSKDSFSSTFSFPCCPFSPKTWEIHISELFSPFLNLLENKICALGVCRADPRAHKMD